MKIYIIGPSGSGKTTIATQISSLTRIPHTDLDEIFWDNNQETYGIKRETSIRDKLFHEVLEKDSWIVEGAYPG